MESEWVGVISYRQRGRESKWASAILYNLPPQVRSTSNLNNSGSIHAREDLLTALECPMYTAYIWWTVQFYEKLTLWAFNELPLWWIAASMKSHLTNFSVMLKQLENLFAEGLAGGRGGGDTQTCDVTMIFSILLWANWVDGPLPSMLGPLLSFTSQGNHITPIVNLKLQ